VLYLEYRTQYGLYQDAVQLCNTVDEEKWKRAVLWVFDAPDIGNMPFEVTHYHKLLLTFVRKELKP
jgi:hypothetical protein